MHLFHIFATTVVALGYARFSGGRPGACEYNSVEAVSTSSGARH